MAGRRSTPTRSTARPVARVPARHSPSRRTSRAASLGTETDGSILCPASVNGVVGIKPTVGLTSRAGVIPISHSQDTVGPFGRTVADAAVLLGAIADLDPRDPATQAIASRAQTDYIQYLDADALRGARIGVAARGPYFGYSEKSDALSCRAR